MELTEHQFEALEKFEKFSTEMFREGTSVFSARPKLESNGKVTIDNGRMQLEIIGSIVVIWDLVSDSKRTVVIQTDRGLVYALTCALHWAVERKFVASFK